MTAFQEAVDGASQYKPEPENAGEARPGRRFTLMPFDTIRLSKGRNYIVKNLIPREGLVIIWAPPKCGKTFWTFDLLMHVALGWEYRGRRVLQGPVVYLACEGERGLNGRIEAFRREKLDDEQSKGVPFHLIATRLNLSSEREILIKDIRAQIDETNPVAIVIDTLNRSLHGSESNDADMAEYVRAADTVREAFGCVVVVVHHCGIEGSRPRGHTSLTGAADAQIAVAKAADGTVTTKLEYMKDGPEGEETFSRLNVVDVGQDEDGDSITSCAVVPADPIGKAAKRVQGAARVALDALDNALCDQGELAPQTKHISRTSNVVRRDVWRTYCEAVQITEADTPDAKRKAFTRAEKKLQDLGIIGVWNEWVWRADTSNKAGQV